jgi:hypothetical protein
VGGLGGRGRLWCAPDRGELVNPDTVTGRERTLTMVVTLLGSILAVPLDSKRENEAPPLDSCFAPQGQFRCGDVDGTRSGEPGVVGAGGSCLDGCLAKHGAWGHRARAGATYGPVRHAAGEW